MPTFACGDDEFLRPKVARLIGPVPLLEVAKEPLDPTADTLVVCGQASGWAEDALREHLSAGGHAVVMARISGDQLQWLASLPPVDLVLPHEPERLPELLKRRRPAYPAVYRLISRIETPIVRTALHRCMDPPHGVALRSVTDLAEHLRCSRSYLYGEAKQVGIALGLFARWSFVLRAITVRRAGLSWCQVAHRSGMGQSAFSHMVKRTTGQAPSRLDGWEPEALEAILMDILRGRGVKLVDG